MFHQAIFSFPTPCFFVVLESARNRTDQAKPSQSHEKRFIGRSKEEKEGKGGEKSGVSTFYLGYDVIRHTTEEPR